MNHKLLNTGIALMMAGMLGIIFAVIMEIGTGELLPSVEER